MKALAIVFVIGASLLLASYLQSLGAGASDASTVRMRLPPARAAEPAPAFSVNAEPMGS
jgi:hypothetical protein